MAALVSCRTAGASLRDACLVANAAAGIAVAKVGTAAVTLAELRARLFEAPDSSPDSFPDRSSDSGLEAS
jgi:bifunctional ADP-heptose synthase (sugar kinase/adenylyltransferase)